MILRNYMKANKIIYVINVALMYSKQVRTNMAH
jgi:hypothetical protein